MAATKVPDFRLYELERKAEDILKQHPRCIGGLRVDIELLVELSGVRVESYAGLLRKWDTYAFPDVTGRFIFVDAGLMDAERLRAIRTLPQLIAYLRDELG